MRALVYGTGGVGGYFGGRLAAAGHDVTFVARGRHLEAIRRDGLQVQSLDGDFVLQPANATDDPSEVGPVDLVLVGVKAWQVPAAAAALAPVVRTSDDPDEATVVVPLQNGVDAADELAAVLGEDVVVGGLCRIAAAIAGPGRIVHSGLPPTVVLGERDGRSRGRIDRIRQAFETSGFAVEVPEDIHVALWQKFLLIAPWGGLGALTRLTLDGLCGGPETRALLERAMGEVSDLAAAHGVALPADAVATTLAMLESLPPGQTASMQRDLMEGRPSELEQQTGAIVRRGRERQVDTPVNGFVHDCLVASERRARETAGR